MMKTKSKRLPRLATDTAAEQFVAEADLADYDLSDFKPMRFEIAPKAAALNIRLPPAPLDAIKAKASATGVPYTCYVRMLREADVAQSR